MIVDAHLDLAYNACRGRDVMRPAAEQAADDEGTPSVGLPDLRRGGVGLICATIYCEPALRPGSVGYRTREEAHSMARRQAAWYARQEQAGELRLVRRAAELPGAMEAGAMPAIMLMEGADPVEGPGQFGEWFDAGVRIVGLAWKRTHYAGGSGAPGPLTVAGMELVRELDRFGVIHDVSHLAEEAFWQLLDMSDGPIIASHSNCRAIIPTDRQLSDEMIRALIERGGVIGVNFFDKFLIPPAEAGRRATLADVVRQIRHVCDLAGNAKHVGIGTDMDGGFGRERLPVEFESSADLVKLERALRDGGFGEWDVEAILYGNWLRAFTGGLQA